MIFETTHHRLSDVIEIIGGGTPKRKIDKYWNGNIPWLSVADFNSGARFVNDTVEKITSLGVGESSTKLLETGQIIISARGTVGCLAQLSRPMAFNQSCYGLTGKEEFVGNDYLYYLMNLKVEELKQKTHGAVFDTITKETFNHVEVDLPPIPIQKKVAKILGDLDSKIELNRQTNQTLEDIAQAIFKSWFVDFEPTRAKVITKEKGGDEEAQSLAAQAVICGAMTLEQLSELSTDFPKMEDKLHSLIMQRFRNTPSAGLDKWTPESISKLADQFPNALVDSELGEIPEGWTLGELRNIAAFTTGRISVSTLTLENYISTENMLEGKKGISNAASLPAVKTVPSFNEGHILISNIRPYFMKIWLARFEGGRSNDVLGIEAKELESVPYLYNLLYHDVFFNFMMTTSKGAKMPRGDKEAIMGWVCVQPTLAVKKAYSNITNDFYKIIDSNNKENKILENAKDALLPKLLSGDLQLKEHQAELEKAVG